MGVDADVLLAGPRGRGLLVHLIDDVAVRTLIMRADFARRSGTSAMLYASAPARPGWGLIDCASMRRERARAEREMRWPVNPQELAAAIAAAPMPLFGAAELVERLVRTVDDAKPYQPPDGNEAVVADPLVRKVLDPIARRVAESEFTKTWGVATGDQWIVAHADSCGNPPNPRDPGTVLAEWKHQMVEAENAAHATGGGGMWWSRPPHELSSTTSRWPDFGPVALYLEEDGRDPDVATATPVGGAPERTFEIDGADSWAHLCGEYGLDTSHALGSSWDASMGGHSAWVVPDWQAVSADRDAVHLTIAGYLEAATRPISVRDGVSSAIAGWHPDETVWLASRPSARGEAVEWRRHQHLGWRVAPGDADSL